MKKFFSLPIIKQSIKSVWIWILISVVAQSVNFFAQSSQAEDGTQLLVNFFVDSSLMFNGMIFLTIIAVLLGTILITNEVDRGSLAIALSTPTTRTQILLSKCLVMAGSLLLMNLLIGTIGSLAPIMFRIEFDQGMWWTIIALWLCYTFLVAGISFFAACWFNKSRFSIATTALVLGIFYLLGMIAMMEDFAFFRFFTLQTLFNTDAVIEGNRFLWQFIVILVIAIPLYIFGVLKFSKKDLPL